MRSVDWQEAFRDAPPRRDLNFRRKQDDRNFLVRLPLGLKHYHILLPKGFIQGQKLQETLRQLTLPFSNSTDFDRLPTPFRAVATDLETGDAVLLDKGDLSIAMRASISAPGVFAPVDYEGRLLVDGGLADNLPIDVARDMKADILIVSDVSFPLQPRERLDSALSISNQTLAILVRKNADRQKATLGPRDILIEPSLGTSPAADFTDCREHHRAGRAGCARRRIAACGARRQRGGVPGLRGAACDARAGAARDQIRARRSGVEALREDHSCRDGAARRQAAGPRCKSAPASPSCTGWGISRRWITRSSSRARARTRTTAWRCGRGANPGVRITCASA